MAIIVHLIGDQATGKTQIAQLLTVGFKKQNPGKSAILIEDAESLAPAHLRAAIEVSHFVVLEYGQLPPSDAPLADLVLRLEGSYRTRSEGIRYCKDCAHCDLNPPRLSTCNEPSALRIDLVYGPTPVLCRDARSASGPCGTAGSLFVAQPANSVAEIVDRGSDHI